MSGGHERVRARASAGLAVAIWVASLAAFAYALDGFARRRSDGVAEFDADGLEALTFTTAVATSATLGLIVVLRQRRHPVGWLFLGLGSALALVAAADERVIEFGMRRGSSDSITSLAMASSSVSFVLFFTVIAAVLQLTPTGRPVGRGWRWFLIVTSAGAVFAVLTRPLDTYDLDPPQDVLRNPWALRGTPGVVLGFVNAAGIYLALVGLVGGAVSLVVRFRRATGVERQQLRWMSGLAVVVPAAVILSTVGALADVGLVRDASMQVILVVIPLSAALSVQRYRLYDVDRLVSRAAAYALSTAMIAALFASLVGLAGLALGGVVDDSATPAVVATVLTITVARPLHHRIQGLVDRRFDRRRYDARRLVEDHVRRPRPDRRIDAVLVAATHDPSLSVAYPIAGGGWIDADGLAAAPAGNLVSVEHHGEVVARIAHDPERVSGSLVTELGHLAGPELDNVRLRAEVARQLEAVRSSRARIVEAQTIERRRVERDIHDGAQQRLLGVGLQLRAVQGDGSTGDPRIEVAIAELATAIRELRDLANGLHPPTLADGGLAAALDELTGRAPIPVRLTADAGRAPTDIELAIWFVAAEALANTVKHADANRLDVRLDLRPTEVALDWVDDGRGGADPHGRGLRGLADRVEALGGTFAIASPSGQGTRIEVRVPCGS